jgi:hypothetical protein
LIQNQKDEADNVRQSQIILGVTVLTLGILSVGPGVCATEPSEVDANSNATGEPFSPDEGARISLPLQTSGNLTLGAVTESSAENAEADQLAKQLSNPISSLISVPFQANEDFGYGPDWGVRFALTLLYPTGRRPESIETTGFVK